VKSHDELGLLTESFNIMTMQLADAQADAQRNQEQVAAAKIYLESVLGNLSAGVMSFDAELHLRSANLSAERILGVDVSDLLGTHPDAWAQRDWRLGAVSRAVSETLISARDGPCETQVELLGASGQQVLLLRGSSLSAGAQSGMVLVFDDITRMRQAQRLAAWGEVAQRLAHEIKNPLTPIQLSAERLEHRLAAKLSLEDAQILQRSTQTIVNQVAALKAMVDAFSLYARSPVPDLQPLDLNQLIREVLGLYESSRPAIKLELAAQLPLVSGDTAKLRQVIHNLLQNAEQAVADVVAPRIVVRTEATEAGVQLVLRDNGAGFPDALMGRLFEPYVTTKSKGTGLGLAIVRKIIEEHNGRVTLSNDPAGGASVSIVLPPAAAKVTELRQNRLAGI
jgi:two-component system, NtrC family, nitrogen regulation sensor histidine kinase NtrY